MHLRGITNNIDLALKIYIFTLDIKWPTNSILHLVLHSLQTGYPA